MGRQKYFKMVIKLCLSDSKLNLQLIRVQSLIDLLVISKFVSQSILEKTLYSLKIKDRNRLISLDNFDGQLECDLQGIPYWNVYLQTSALTTSRSIAKSIYVHKRHKYSIK